MLRKMRVVPGAVALIGVVYVTAFAAEDMQRSIVVDDASGGAARAITLTVCSSGCDFTSIQAAVNAASDGDKIELGAETFYENVIVGKGLTIQGAGRAATVVDGQLAGIVFVVGATAPVELSDMTIQNGGSTFPYGEGGVFGFMAELTVSNVLVQENQGPGIIAFTVETPTTIEHSMVRGHQRGVELVGVSTDLTSLSPIRIDTTEITGNARGIVGDGPINLRITKSMIGVAPLTADAISVAGRFPWAQPRVEVTGSTIEGVIRQAADAPCVLYSLPVCTHMDIRESTIVGSLRDLYVGELVASIVANTESPTCTVLDLPTAGFLSAYSLFTDLGCQPASDTNITNSDPLLLELADNGGPTPTHALHSDSAAIDAGGDECEPTDQRGVSRPQDGDGDGEASCDIGAYEYEREVLDVGVDIMPGSYPNSVNPYSRGVVPVAILGNDTFEVEDIDVTTLRFGPSGAAPTHSHPGHHLDQDLDGYMDLMVHFKTQDTGIVCGDSEARLSGSLLDGLPFEGSDTVQTVGCSSNRPGRRPGRTAERVRRRPARGLRY